MANNTANGEKFQKFFAISRALLPRVFSISPDSSRFPRSNPDKELWYRWRALRCNADEKKKKKNR